MPAVNITLQPRARSTDPSVDHAIQAIVAGASTGETCNTDLAAGPWNFDTRPGYGPGSSMGDVIPTGSPRQGELPREYREASEDGARRAHPRRQGDARRPGRDPRPLLPARRGRACTPTTWATRSSSRTRRRRTRRPRRSCSAACTSWPRPPTCSRAPSRPSSCRTSPPAARWPTWPTSTRSRSAGSSSQRSTATWTPRTPTAWCPSSPSRT